MSEQNPFKPPEAPLSAPQDGVLRRATLAQRFATYLLDMIFYYIFSFIIGFVLAFAGMAGVLKSVPGMLLGAIFLFLYYVPQEAYFGRTLGKWIARTKAVSEDGTPLTVKQAAMRTLCRFIPFEFVSFFGAGAEGPRGWHDRFANTVVISTAKD